MEGAGDLNGHDPLRSQLLRQLTGHRDGLRGAGDHDLARGVVVRHPDVALGPLAGRFGVVVGDAEEGGHRPRRLLAGPSHRLTTGDDELYPVLEAEGTAGHESGVLAETVPGARCRRESGPFHGVEHHEAEDRGRQLGVLRLGELLNRRFEEQ